MLNLAFSKEENVFYETFGQKAVATINAVDNAVSDKRFQILAELYGCGARAAIHGLSCQKVPFLAPNWLYLARLELGNIRKPPQGAGFKPVCRSSYFHSRIS